MWITTDNFFTLIPLADELWDKKTTLTETLRYNKWAIPPQFLKDKNREVHKSQFGFQEEKNWFPMCQSSGTVINRAP